MFLKYKEYKASVNFSAEDNIFFGKNLDCKDLLLFEGKTVRGLKKVFKEAVDDYI